MDNTHKCAGIGWQMNHQDCSMIAAKIAEMIQPMVTQPRWLTIKMACEYGRFSRETLMRLINAGEVKGKKRFIGGWIVDRLSIDEYNSIDGGQDDAIMADVAKRIGL